MEIEDDSLVEVFNHSEWMLHIPDTATINEF